LLFASKEFLPMLSKPQFHYRVYKSPLLVPVLSHTNPFHAFPCQFFEINFYTTSRSTSWFFKPYFCSYSNQTLHLFLYFPQIVHLFHFSYPYDLTNGMTWGRSLLRHCVTSREVAVSMLVGAVGTFC
jgi:hypothetical protein